MTTTAELLQIEAAMFSHGWLTIAYPAPHSVPLVNIWHSKAEADKWADLHQRSGGGRLYEAVVVMPVLPPESAAHAHRFEEAVTLLQELRAAFGPADDRKSQEYYESFVDNMACDCTGNHFHPRTSQDIRDRAVEKARDFLVSLEAPCCPFHAQGGDLGLSCGGDRPEAK